MAEIIYEQESYNVMGACFEVYKAMGHGFSEPVYQECLEIELTQNGILFVAQRKLQIVYKGCILEQFYKPDLVCYDKLIIEVKAVAQLLDAHRAQIFNYLRATKMRLGILVNFGAYPKLEYERIVL